MNSVQLLHHNRFFIPVILIIGGLATYAITGSFELLSTWDDNYYIGLNQTITSFSTEHLRQAFTGFYLGNYAPLNILSFMVDYALWGMNPLGYHFENILIHILNALLLYFMLRRMKLGNWQAGSVSWIFMLHPVQVETVAWISQRKSLLAMLFFLGALYSYHSYTERKNGGILQYLSSLFLLSAALLSKSIAVIFPVLLILHDISYFRDDRRAMAQKILDKLPFIAIATLIAIVAVDSQNSSNSITQYPGGSRLSTLYTMTPVLISYLGDCFWPTGLIPFYMVPIRLQPDPAFWISLLILTLLLIVGIYIYREQRTILLWYSLFFVALLPVLQIVPLVTLKNDRYLYTPIIGFSIMVVFTYQLLCQKLPQQYLQTAHVIALIIMLAMPFLTFKQTLQWKNDIVLWAHTVAIDPENRLGWLQLGISYTMQQDWANARFATLRYQQLRDKYGPVRGF